MLHVLHVTQIIEVLLYIEALHVKALHFKANRMDFFKIKDLFGRPMINVANKMAQYKQSKVQNILARKASRLTVIL